MAFALGLWACSEPAARPVDALDRASATVTSSVVQGGATSSASGSAIASGSAAVSGSATANGPARAMTAGGLTLDGFRLGDRFSSVMGRDPYTEPCDNDPIDKRKRRFMVYGALPCRGRTFPEGTTVAFYLAFADGADRYAQPIEAFAWLGGTYFESRSSFPLRVGQSVRSVDGVLGEPSATVEVSRNGKSLTARRHAGDIWSVAEGEAVVGFVLGPMPTDPDSEQWRGLAQMYFRYTKPEK